MEARGLINHIEINFIYHSMAILLDGVVYFLSHQVNDWYALNCSLHQRCQLEDGVDKQSSLAVAAFLKLFLFHLFFGETFFQP